LGFNPSLLQPPSKHPKSGSNPSGLVPTFQPNTRVYDVYCSRKCTFGAEVLFGEAYAFDRLGQCLKLKVSLLEEHVGEPSSLKERSRDGISGRNCSSREVRRPMDEEALWPGAAHGRGGACTRG